MDLLRAGRGARPLRSFATARPSPTVSSGTSAHIFQSWDAWKARVRRARGARLREYGALQGTLAQGRRPAAGGDTAVRRDRAACRTRSGTSPSLKYDEDQRDNDINARRQQVQILFAKATGERVVQPRAAADSPGDRPGVDGGQSRAGRLPLRDRGPLPAAGTRPRRKGRAPAVAVQPLLVDARTTRIPRCRRRT